MDIRNFFQPSEGDCIARGQKRKERFHEMPMESAYKGYFGFSQPKAGREPLVSKRNKKRAKVEAVRPFQKMASKLSIMQWHFSQPSSNCVVTANRFFSDQPAKVNRSKLGQERSRLLHPKGC